MASSACVFAVLWFSVLQTCDSACAVNSTILSFSEDVPPGTTIMHISRQHGDQWAFREDGPEGYIGLSHDANNVIFTFLKSPDLEEINNGTKEMRHRESLPFTLECTYHGWKHVFKQELVILDVNDNDPYFVSGPFVTEVSEITTIGSPVFGLKHLAVDPDINGRVIGYRLHPYIDRSVDGGEMFTLSPSGSEVILQSSLDFDTMESAEKAYYMLNISAVDDGYPDPRSGFTTLRLYVMDADDLGPAFVYENCPLVDGYCATPSYEAIMKSTFLGPLRIWPAQIRAQDRDSLNFTIKYSIIKVKPPGYEDHFEIDTNIGEVRVLMPLQRPNIDTLHIVIKAEEASQSRRYITATLRIQISSRGRYINGFPGMLRDIPYNDVPPNFSGSENGTGELSIPFSIFMSTVGVFLAVMCGMLIIFIRLAKGKPVKTSLATHPGIRKHSNDSSCSGHMSYNSTDTGTCVVYSSSPEDDVSSTTSRNSSVDFDFDDATSFAPPRSSDAHATSVSFASQECGNYSPNPTRRNSSSTSGLSFWKKLQKMFSLQNFKKNKRTRVRFDIRNISEF